MIQDNTNVRRSSEALTTHAVGSLARDTAATAVL
jgi:hypothetical protein